MMHPTEQMLVLVMRKSLELSNSDYGSGNQMVG
jgi:hypothetical protein